MKKIWIKNNKGDETKKESQTRKNKKKTNG